MLRHFGLDYGMLTPHLFFVGAVSRTDRRSHRRLHCCHALTMSSVICILTEPPGLDLGQCR